jgi:glycosyltransferase involved in cell wall biosynthesis
MTLVSIITPSYNQAAYLEETIRSVLDQGYLDLEYMIVDGGSTDGSLEIIKKYASRLDWWVSERDSGQAEAINKGLAHAHGEFVAWLNSDDIYLPGAVARAVTALEANAETVMVYGNMLAVDKHGRITNLLKYRQLSLEDLLAFQIIGQPAVFMRKAAVEQAGGLNPSFHFMLDHHLWIRLAALGPICHVDSTWAAARYHPEAKNRAQAPEFGREAFQILDWAQSQPELTSLLAHMGRRARASAYRVQARYLLDGGQPWAALEAWGRTLAIHPPTAFARLNLLVSAALNLAGLGGLRLAYLRWRQNRLSHTE